MAVSIDCGEYKNIHPKVKQTIGARLAALCAKYTFGMKPVKADYARPVSVQYTGNTLTLKFSNTGKLISGDGKPIRYFEVGDASGKRYPVPGNIKGKNVILSIPQIKAPKLVYYAWTHKIIEKPNLYSAEGLPVPCFKVPVK